jgi:enoyl-CoA hydratase/carnithine racemase
MPAFAKHLVATPDTFFHLPEISMGLIPGAGGCVSIPRRIGRQRMNYLAITGTKLSVETAINWGLIDEIAG